MADPAVKPSLPEPTPSPIVRVLNRHVGRYHRWSTPAILGHQERVEDFYESDVSISAGFFGTQWRRDRRRDTTLRTLRVL